MHTESEREREMQKESERVIYRSRVKCRERETHTHTHRGRYRERQRQTGRQTVLLDLEKERGTDRQSCGGFASRQPHRVDYDGHFVIRMGVV